MDEEISQSDNLSKKTIVVLVILTVIISVIGNLVVMNEVSSIKSAPSSQKTLAPAKNPLRPTGQVEITIQSPPQQDSATGMVSLTILPK